MSILSVDNISPIGSGTSVTVNSAATLVLTNANSSGVITATSFVGNLTGNVTGTASANAVLTGSTNNTLVTVTGANAITGESNLTYDGTDLTVTGSNTKIIVDSRGSNGDQAHLQLLAKDASGNNNFGELEYDGDGDFSISSRGSGAANNSIVFKTTSSNVERLRIASNGNVHIGSGNPTIAKLQVSGAGFFGSANTTKTNDGVIIERNSGDGLAHITAGRSGGNYSGFDFYVAGASGVTKRHSIDYQSNFKWFAANGTTERAKITSDGYCKFTSNGAYDGYANAQQAHEFRQSLNKPTLWCSNTTTSQTWDIIRAEAARSNNSAFQFYVATSGNLSDDEFRVRGDGNVYADGTFNPNGADYAEYFEWTDGNSSNEDRRGMTVVLDGNKIKVSTSSDSTDNIIGVVSGNASVIGDSSWNKWSDKYLRDDYGAYQRDENGERKLNPSFDDTKTYVSREDRQEWDAIGMVGKLRIRKGQITGTRWIKMRDISDTVEEWLVR